jgi:hypothetical protein
MDTWQREPLGFALVDETTAGTLAVHHVSVSEELGVLPTGAWLLPDPDPGVVRDLLTHRVIDGTSDGIRLTQAIIQEQIAPARLSGLVRSCETSQQELTAAWESYRDEQPVKRANLVPLKAPTWPDFTDDGDAATILQRVGKRPYSPDTPVEMRDIIALAYLVSYVVEAWYDLETERISRAYLNGGNTERSLYPTNWAKAHPPYWPRAN